MSASKVETITVRYDGEDRVIPKEMWKKNKLDAAIVGEARVVVRRGSLLANIPDDVPFGTFCICVNLPSIQDPSSSNVTSTADNADSANAAARAPAVAYEQTK